MGVHIYLYSEDVPEVECPHGAGHGPGQRKSLCHAISDADGKFTFKSIPCGKHASCCLGLFYHMCSTSTLLVAFPLICLSSEDVAYHLLYIIMGMNRQLIISNL